ncbi:band 4.1-like protein 4 [Thrips palmi]|uniref:Erythrocyte membrane protein band 4.1-like 4A n=1 Tax=Thrips palmi TaxID=161013 RepID=A0A6P8YT69_THRPL|nr:band 4.1-like protein 4 [Thrips palmi]
MGCFCKKVRTFHCKVVLLDEQELVQEIQENSPGHEVLDTVFRHLNLLETAYFGLRYLDTANQPHWLDPTKKVARELKGTISCTLYFGVKFYAADPCKLLEEITRYQFYLQVKQDILQGRLPVNFDLAAELGAYVVQSELGDYDPRRHSPGYVSEFRFVSNQSAELESRISELHKGLLGQLPADAELAYLDRVKWLDMYGVDLHPVLGEDNVEYFLGLTPSGIIVLRNKNKVGNYYWPRITKIYFKGRYFMLRVCDKNNEESTYGFETPSRTACKQLWKCCVEHHAFFRLVRVSPAPNEIFRLSSRFRYRRVSSGRTEKQARCDVEAGRRAPPTFERSPSRRQQRRVVEGAASSTASATAKWQGRRVVEGAPHSPSVEEIENRESLAPQDKGLPVPNPTSVVTAPAIRRPSPPLSTRSAPWTEPHARGLYNSASSPRSLRSAASTGRIVAQAHGASGASRRHASGPHRRSSSVESHSSTDSRPCRRHRRHRSRKGSDSESEVSKCSERCHSRCRNRHHRHKSRHKSSNRPPTGQRDGPATGTPGGPTPRRPPGGGPPHPRPPTPPDSAHGRHKRRVRTKHRSRSRSPSESKRLPDELKQHLDFDLVDTEGMTEAQLREIPYTVIQTTTKPVKVKMSPNNRRRVHRSSRRSLKSHEDGGSTDRLSVNSQPVSRSAMSIPPLPFSPSASSLLGNGGSAAHRDRVDRHQHAVADSTAANGNHHSPSQGGSMHVPPLPRVPSAAQLNGSTTNIGHQDQNQPPKHVKGYPGGQQGQHYSLHINRPASATGMAPATHAKGMSTFASRTPSRTPSRTSSPQGSSERLENGNGLDNGNMGVTSFMSNGQGHGLGHGQGNVNRVRSALAQLPPNGSANGNGANSPHSARLWDEVISSGGRPGTGAGAGAGSAGRLHSLQSLQGSAASNHLHHHLGLGPGLGPHHRGSTGSTGSRRTSSSNTPSQSPLPPIVTPHGVTFQHTIGNGFGGAGSHRARQQQQQQQQQQQSSGRSRAGPLYFQQQQQMHTAVIRNPQSDNASIKAVSRTGDRVQNAAYSSLQYSDPALNGNEPSFRSQSRDSGRDTGRGSKSTGTQASSETCTEL